MINVVDLMKLQPKSEHPHGLDDHDFDALFTTDRPVIFAYHGYPWLIHRLTYRRTNHDNLHVRGYKEEGTITTPFDMTVLNDMDRFHLASDAIHRLPQLEARAAYAQQDLRETWRRDRGLLKAEVSGSGLPLRSGGEHELAGFRFGHVSCLHEVCRAFGVRRPLYQGAEGRYQALRNSLARIRNTSACWYWAPWFDLL